MGGVENMKAKKGYALILSLVVVSLILILATSVLQLSVSAYKSAKNIEENNKIKLAAEAGIEKGQLVLKNYILTQTSNIATGSAITFNYLNFNPNEINGLFTTDLNYEVNGINCEIQFLPDDPSKKFKDISTDRDISYIEIVSKATKGLSTKTITVILDKTSLKNIYYNQIFNYTFTTADNINNGVSPSVNIEDASKLDITGNIFLQGKDINLFPSNGAFSFLFNEGKVTVNTNSLVSKVAAVNDYVYGIPIALFKNKSAITSVPGWKNLAVEELSVLPIKQPSLVEPKVDKILKFSDISTQTIDSLKNDYIRFQQPRDPFSNTIYVDQLPTLVTYKVNNSPGTSINFRNLIDGTDYENPDTTPGVYSAILSTLVEQEKAAALKAGTTITDDVAKAKAIENYKKFYKLILVDGDLEIDDIFDEKFINYLIYCTGKVTFKGEAHFYNSSIFARNIEIKGQNFGKGVQFYGVQTEKSRAYVGTDNRLSDFSSNDKLIINEYLIRNLEGYADHIEYTIVQWK